MKIVAFCKKKGLLIQNLRLGIHIDQIWADSITKNTLKYLTTYMVDLPNRRKY